MRKYMNMQLKDINYNYSDVIVYAICSPSGNCYIGSTKSGFSRWCRHRSDLRLGNHHSKSLQRAYVKYGENNIYFQILEFVKDSNQLILNEQKWIDILKPKYNISLFAGKPMKNKSISSKITKNNTGKSLSEEHKRKISNSLKGRFVSEETRSKISKIRKGVILSKEVRDKISISNKGKIPYNKGIPHSKETRDKISKSKSIPVICLDTNIVRSSAKEFEDLGFCKVCISKVCRGQSKHHKGLKFKFLHDFKIRID